MCSANLSDAQAIFERRSRVWLTMSKTLERRSKQREQLIEAAERAMAAKGLAGLKTRDLAQEIGVANGAVYNLVADVDDLVLMVGSRTLARLDDALSAAERDGPPAPPEALVCLVFVFCVFVVVFFVLWCVLFV